MLNYYKLGLCPPIIHTLDIKVAEFSTEEGDLNN